MQSRATLPCGRWRRPAEDDAVKWATGLGTRRPQGLRAYPRLAVDIRWQPNGLANGRAGAHIRGMEKYRSRMLEVTVTNRPPKWEWEVSSGGQMLANGVEGEQIAAKFEGN